jgi:2'-5' RNA ligase
MPPLIVTLQMDEMAFERLDALRRRHFPPQRNFLPAHITLFHALPEAEETAIREKLRDVVRQTAPMPLRMEQPRFLGFGVALDVMSDALIALRGTLAHTWAPWLTAQDQQRYKPHVTVQNKASADAAKALHEQLAREWQPLQGQGTGLLLWRYQGGPWERVETFAFAGDEK